MDNGRHELGNSTSPPLFGLFFPILLLTVALVSCDFVEFDSNVWSPSEASCENRSWVVLSGANFLGVESKEFFTDRSLKHGIAFAELIDIPGHTVVEFSGNSNALWLKVSPPMDSGALFDNTVYFKTDTTVYAWNIERTRVISYRFGTESLRIVFL